MNPADLFAREENPVALETGGVLFRAGEPGDCMFMLLAGALNVMVAAAPSKLARIDQRRFHRVVAQNPFFAMHIMKELADRIRSMNTLLAQR